MAENKVRCIILSYKFKVTATGLDNMLRKPKNKAPQKCFIKFLKNIISKSTSFNNTSEERLTKIERMKVRTSGETSKASVAHELVSMEASTTDFRGVKIRFGTS